MRQSERGATLVEAAVVLPLLLLLVFGLVEFGRYIALTSTVTNASREAVRYAVATGPGGGGVPQYADCDGIRDAARQFGVLAHPTDAQITLEYDHGPGTAMFETCAGTSADPDAFVDGDRIRATVTIPFQTVVPLIDGFLGPTDISIATTRTINKG